MSEPAPPAGFVNSVGLRLLRVEPQPFDAWVPSMRRRGEQQAHGGKSDAAFALNRPRVPETSELSEPYYLAELPVTNAIYRRFVAETGHRQPGGVVMDIHRRMHEGDTWELAEYAGDNLPATGVNNEDIAAFCAWLSAREGRTYRVPAINEYEYANRAGTDSLFWWGAQPDVRRMNFALSRVGHPAPVGSYPANPWGFHDLHGNVWEYCADRDWFMAMGSAFNSPQVLTGADAWGNFNQGPNLMRLLSTGFRLACDGGEGARRGSTAEPTEPHVAAVAAGGKGPAYPALEIQIGDRIDLGPVATNAVNMLATRDGTWVLNDKRSTDGGRTWQPCLQLGEAKCQLRDGTVLAVLGPDSGGGPCRIDEPLSGQGRIALGRSTDDWATVEEIAAPVHVPLGRQFLPVRGLVELDDGRLLLTMYGHLDGDLIREDSPVAFELDPEWIKTRVILVESSDGGRSWRYRSTVSYRPDLTSEGQNESDLLVLPDGDLIAVMRTGIHGTRDPHGREFLDQPVLMAWSTDQGRTWTEPQRIHVGDRLITGIYPRLQRTAAGVLAMLRARPDGSVVLSPDGAGSLWTDEVFHYRAEEGNRHAGMQDLIPAGPDTVLVTDLIIDNAAERRYHVEGVPLTVTRRSTTDRP